MTEDFILITGRTWQQGATMEGPGKMSTPYQEAVALCELDEKDMELTELEEVLGKYFGYIEGVRAGVVEESPPEKPDVLICHEMTEDTGLPLEAGGVMDQPHIWLLELGVLMNVKAEWDQIAIMNARARQPQET